MALQFLSEPGVFQARFHCPPAGFLVLALILALLPASGLPPWLENLLTVVHSSRLAARLTEANTAITFDDKVQLLNGA